MKVLLKKYKPNGEIEFTPVYFNSLTKLVINHGYKLNKSFQEILYRIDAWINEGSGWIVESTESLYINIPTYKPLVGSSYIDLPIELSNPRKGLINIKNNDQKCFLWCHVRHINLVEKHPERIKKKLIKELLIILIMKKLNFLYKKKIELQNNICINVSGYENELVYPIFISKQTFEDSIDLLLLIKKDKSHYVYIKDFNTFMFHKTKNKNKKWFCKSCLQCFSSKNMLIKHKEDCLSINRIQPVDVEEGIIKFENYFKQLSVPFKIYADFECNLKDTEICEGSCTKKYHDHVPCTYAFKAVCIYNRFSKPIVVYRGKNAAYEFIKAILKEYKYCKNIMKKHFNKNLIMKEEEDHSF